MPLKSLKSHSQYESTSKTKAKESKKNSYAV